MQLARSIKGMKHPCTYIQPLFPFYLLIYTEYNNFIIYHCLPANPPPHDTKWNSPSHHAFNTSFYLATHNNHCSVQAQDVMFWEKAVLDNTYHDSRRLILKELFTMKNVTLLTLLVLSAVSGIILYMQLILIIINYYYHHRHPNPQLR